MAKKMLKKVLRGVRQKETVHLVSDSSVITQQPAVNHIWESTTNMFVSYWIKEIFDNLPSELNVQANVPTRDVLLIFRMLTVIYVC